MNDYKRIRHSGYGYRRLSPWDTRAVHLASVRALREFLTTHDPKRSVVVTHHAPSILSLPEHRRTEAISCAYTQPETERKNDAASPPGKPTTTNED